MSLILNCPNQTNLDLIWPGAISNLFAFGVDHYDKISFSDYDSLYVLFKKYIDLFDAYSNLPEPDRTDKLKLFSEVKKFRCEFMSKEYFLEKDFDKSYLQLSAGLASGEYQIDRAILFGKDLIGHFKEIKDTNQAFATLDMLSF
ncbi:MAG: hypothetical protein ABIY90_19835, partial [Puia sp.]